MQSREPMTPGKMAVLFTSFVLGSSIIYIPQVVISFSQNIAWLATAISSLWGLMVWGIVLYLYKKYPGLTFIEASRQVLGKWPAMVIGINFLFLFLTMLVLIVISIGGFFASSMMSQTPLYIYTSLIMLLAALIVRSGMEVMARMFIVLLFVMFVFIYTVYFLTIPHYQTEWLLPMFPDGIKPLLHGIYYTAGFPFAEIAVFAMLFPFVGKDKNKGKHTLGKLTFLSWAVSSVTLVLSMLITMIVLGPLATEREFSLYSLAQVVSIYDIVDRIESFVGIALIAGSLMKATISLYLLNLTTVKLFRIADPRLPVFPLSFVAFLLTVTMYDNKMAYSDVVNNVWPFMAIVCIALPVILVAAVAFVKDLVKA